MQTDPACRFTLSDALSTFADERREIKDALTENMLWSISQLPKPTALEGSNLRWVEDEVYRYEVTCITTGPTKVINRITASQQPARLGAITDDMIARAKAFPIEELYEGQLRNGMGKCPFHDDKTSSMSMQKHNRFMCFAGCGHGDSITFYMKLHDVSFIKAVRALSPPPTLTRHGH